MTGGLDALAAKIAADLAHIESPARDWVMPRLGPDGTPVTDVAIVGGGLSGLAVAFALLRRGVTRLAVLDQAPEGFEGPWATTARMRMLRSPKTLTGPDLGIPSLTFRAWFEAQHGPAAWETLTRIGRADWMAYLRWFRDILALPVRNGCAVTRVDGAHGLARLTLQGGNTLFCREVVLATGIDGSGAPHIPACFQALPGDRITHSGARLTTPLAGRTVAVIGAGASAFDLAVAALEGGAEVDLFCRKPALARIEVLAWTNFPGFLGHFTCLDDQRRWRFMREVFSRHIPPTQDMYDRAIAHEKFRMHLAAPIEDAALCDGRVELRTGAGRFLVDHVLLGTGYRTDLSRRPELSAIANDVLLWRDRLPEAAHDRLGDHPYLGSGFQFLPCRPDADPVLAHVRCFNNGALMSLGPVCNGITGLKYGAPLIADAVVRSLFTQDADLHYDSLMAYDEAGFHP